MAELAAADPEEPVAALILLQGELRQALAGSGETGIGPTSELAQLIAQAKSGGRPAADWQIELYPELGALYLMAPAARLARLLADPGVASATVPDQGP